MDKNRQVLHKRSIRYELYVILLMLSLYALARLTLPNRQAAVLTALAAYVLLSAVMYLLFQRDHRRGMRQMEAGQYAQASVSFSRIIA